MQAALTEPAFGPPPTCTHRTHYLDRALARADARRMSRNLGARISPFFCKTCSKWYVAASQERGVFDKTDLDIIKCLTTGLRDRDISQELHMQEMAIRKRVSRMFERTDTNSRAQLVAYAMHIPVVDYGVLMEGESRDKT